MTELPSGTVTFLFTDVERSTRLWDARPTEMSPALARHDRELRQSVEEHGGVIVKSRGDGVHAVFGTAGDAVRAAVTAQRALAELPGPDLQPLGVRIGVHTGEAELRDGDYYGTTLNRAARIQDAAHGGQILVSSSTAAIVADEPDADWTLVDVGRHQLRDLSRAEHIFQVSAPGLRSAFPPLRTRTSVLGNLPQPTTSFVGRTDDVAGVRDAVDHGRLVTIIGTGGVGKTRLAIELAAGLAAGFDDGVWLCELAPAPDGTAMTQVVASALGTPGAADTTTESIVLHVAARSLLLVLDSCEHLLDPVGTLVEAVLRACPGVSVIATSREAFGIGGERVWPLRSLRLPSTDDDPRAIVAGECVQLFTQRATAVRPDFIVDSTNAAAVAEICRRLDGIPLAIELAAARVAAMSPREIATLLDERFRLLAGGRRTSVERHQTLRAAVDWSYALLTPAEQRLFEEVSVFVGGFDADAAVGTVATDLDEWDVRDGLTSLVAKSMILAEDTEFGFTRYRMLDTLAAYAREQLEAHDDVDESRRRHARYFASRASLIETGIMSPESRGFGPMVGLDRDNFRSAVFWALESGRDDDLDLAFTITSHTSRFTFGQAWAEHVLRRAPGTSAQQRALLLTAAAATALEERGDAEAGLALAREALALGIADPRVRALTSYRIAHALVVLGQLDAAIDTLLEAGQRELAAGGEHAAGLVNLLGLTARFKSMRGDPDALSVADEAVRLARAGGVLFDLTGALLNHLGLIAHDDPERALADIDEAMGLEFARRTLVYGRFVATRALLHVRLGTSTNVLAELRDAVTYTTATSAWAWTALTLEIVARTLELVGHAATAATIFACSVAGPLRVQHLLSGPDQQDHDAAMDRLRAKLGTDELDRVHDDLAGETPELAVRRATAALDDLVASAPA